MRSRFIVMAVGGLMASASFAAGPIAYPATEASTVSETKFGVAVDDPYRWLENDVRNDPKVRAWVDAQNKLTQSYLAGMPRRSRTA